MDRMLLFFIRQRHKWSFEMLGIMFGVSKNSAKSYYEEVLQTSMTDCVPRLFYFPAPEEVHAYVPDRFKERFPTALLIGDGVHFAAKVPEDFALQSLSFSV